MTIPIPENIIYRLKKVNKLPITKVVLINVLERLNNAFTKADVLKDILLQDASVTVTVLKIANSPFYSLYKKVSSIEFAIIMLGFEEIRNICLACLGSYNDIQLEKNIFKTYSVLSAKISKIIAMDLGIQKSGELYVAGLLFNCIGLSNIFSLKEIEETIPSLSAIYLEWANIPDSIINLVKNVKEPDNFESSVLNFSAALVAEVMKIEKEKWAIQYGPKKEEIIANLPKPISSYKEMILKINENLK